MIYLDESFADIINTVLPSVSAVEKEKLKEAITQFKVSGKNIDFTSGLLENLSQGDIVSNIPFILYDKGGNQLIHKYNAILLSNTCDASRNTHLIFAPILEINNYNNRNVVDLKNNVIYEYMYLNDNKLGDIYVNFNIIHSINREIILDRLRNNKSDRLCSLTTIGYYMFILKLTIFLLRSEDYSNFISRENYR